MIIAKELEWTRKYIEAVRHLLPKNKKLKRISIKKANKKYVQRVLGVCNMYNDQSYRITLYTSGAYVATIKPLTIHLIQCSTLDILKTLAHELAHLEHWEHTPDHESLTCSIVLVFMAMLKTEGYISEENESKIIKGWRID